jgi:hypothetical protein
MLFCSVETCEKIGPAAFSRHPDPPTGLERDELDYHLADVGARKSGHHGPRREVPGQRYY